MASFFFGNFMRSHTFAAPTRRLAWLPVTMVCCLLSALAACSSQSDADKNKNVIAADPDVVAQTQAAKPALTVSAIQPSKAALTQTIRADGNVLAWREASVGGELSGRIESVAVEVGDKVRRGQELARFYMDIFKADHGQIEATAREAAAAYVEATSSLERAKKLQAQGFMGEQMLVQHETMAASAQARMEQTRAAREASRLRLENGIVRATADGVISRVNVVPGSILPAGTELFGLIEGGRLEWRAQVNAHDMARLQVGMPAEIDLGDGATLAGRIRLLAPTVDVQNRTGLAYIDLEPSSFVRSGMYVSGSIAAGQGESLFLPQSAFVLRDGFSYVMVLEADNRIRQTVVQTGQRQGGLVEIISGLEATDQVVASGAAFLSDGDSVTVVAASQPLAE